LTPTLEPTVGIAFTCELDSSTPTRQTANEHVEQDAGFYPQLEAMGRIAEPLVWVVKAVGSRPDHECILGDGMATLLHSVGCRGVVTDGGVRDLKGLLAVPFAAYGRGTTIHHCALRFRSFNRPVEIGGIWVRPGEVIHADSEGVIKIPTTCLEILAERATQMRSFEHDVHALFRRPDLPLRQKSDYVRASLEKHGFAPAGHRT